MATKRIKAGMMFMCWPSFGDSDIKDIYMALEDSQQNVKFLPVLHWRICHGVIVDNHFSVSEEELYFLHQLIQLND